MLKITMVAIVTIALPATLVIVFLMVGAWPSKWNPEYQASLAVGFLAALLPFYGAGIKTIYDELASGQANVRDLHKLMFTGFEEYSRALLFPLQAISGDLSSALHWKIESNQDANQYILYCVCRYTEAVAIMRIRYTRISAPLPQRGLFLKSPIAEELVWRLLLEPSAFGVPKGAGEAIAVESIRGVDGKLLPVTRLGEGVKAEDFKYVSDQVLEALKDDDKRILLSDTMAALNVVLNWAILVTLKPWYGKEEPFPTEAVDRLHKACRSKRKNIGLYLPNKNP